ncbi:MAG TPA: pyrimidine-nucleoside phosphorylase [Firmicutes bacterium]|nr:pyrimidine-nucleoside phosphorylase [Bacillota bacterium]
MEAVDLIRKKRNGGRLSQKELAYLIEGYLAGSIPDYQMAAFAMAVYFVGMEPAEITDLTLLMAHSGETLDLAEIRGIKVDKHSTGGVGDTTTLITAPLVASLGVPVAKMSGRSLGHTGGTVDKLESIPGYRVELTPKEFINQVNTIGVSIVAQTGQLAPADKLLYALRDVTATVESIPMIASSIMSKKIAAGADGFVLDVKTGTGAFMKTLPEAKELAETMVKIGTLAQKETTALVTDMNQPLGRAIGNALEVKEAILTLGGAGPVNLTELSLMLAAEMVLMARAAADREEARSLLREKLENGAALEKFGELIEAQGGNPRVIEDLTLLPQAEFEMAVKAEAAGYLKSIDPVSLGIAARQLGAGRKTKDEKVDSAVGIVLKKEVGQQVQKGETLAVLYANREKLLEKTMPLAASAFTIGTDQPEKAPLIKARITAKDV